MSERCVICEHDRSLNRCWRLTCPENGGNARLLELARPGPFHKSASKEKLL
jgi:hypothetical protein